MLNGWAAASFILEDSSLFFSVNFFFAFGFLLLGYFNFYAVFAQ